MNIIPVAIESLGARGNCFFVEIPECNILIDPAVSLCPKRKKLEPHPFEISCSYLARLRILYYLERTDLIIQTHYHGDHFTLFQTRTHEFTTANLARYMYNRKIQIFVKDPNQMISINQKNRAKELFKLEIPTIEIVDDKKFDIKDAKITFSKPLWHGTTNVPMGTVLALTIEHRGKKVAFSSDINGPGTDEAMNFILNENADICFLDGPSTYLENKYSNNELDETFCRIDRIASDSKVVIDHHSPRDINWNELQSFYGVNFPNCAEFFSLTPFCAEAKREELHRKKAFSQEFYRDFFNPKSKQFVYIEQELKKLIETHHWNELMLSDKDYIQIKRKLLRYI